MQAGRKLMMCAGAVGALALAPAAVATAQSPFPISCGGTVKGGLSLVPGRSPYPPGSACEHDFTSTAKYAVTLSLDPAADFSGSLGAFVEGWDTRGQHYYEFGVSGTFKNGVLTSGSDSIKGTVIAGSGRLVGYAGSGWSTGGCINSWTSGACLVPVPGVADETTSGSYTVTLTSP
jgi:hypothetical protein